MKIVYSNDLTDFLDNAIDLNLQELELKKYFSEEFPELPYDYVQLKYNNRFRERLILGSINRLQNTSSIDNKTGIQYIKEEH